jgi:hypothetical protein
MVTTATTQTRLREEVRLLLLDDDGGGGADQRDPQRILGGRGPQRRSISTSLGAARGAAEAAASRVRI